MGNYLKKMSLISALCAQTVFSGSAYASETYGSQPYKYSQNLEVIEDRGGQSVERYMPKQKDAEKRIKDRFHKRHSKKLAIAHFPVVTSSMQVGKVTDKESTEVPYQMATRPMFIVGYDPVSLNWLASNKEMLSEKRAVGFVVNIVRVDQMDELQNLVGEGVFIQPMSGDRLAEHLKIKHYPFYMDNRGVMR